MIIKIFAFSLNMKQYFSNFAINVCGNWVKQREKYAICNTMHVYAFICNRGLYTQKSAKIFSNNENF